MELDIMGALKSAHIIEGDDTPKAPRRDTSHAPAVAPVQSFPATAGVPSAASATPIYSSGVTLTADDQARMQKISDQVYSTSSNYTTFVNMRTALGNTPDLNLVFNALKASNSGVTPQKVSADIDSHLGMIDAQANGMDSQIARARQERVDGPMKEVATLQQTIQQMTQQIAADTAKINDLQHAAQTAEHDIADGAARFKAVLDQLRAPLISSKQLLTNVK